MAKGANFTNLIIQCKNMGGGDLRGKSKEVGQEKQRRPNASVRAEIVQWPRK